MPNLHRRITKRGWESSVVDEAKAFPDALREVEEHVNPTHPWSFEEAQTAPGQPKHYQKKLSVFQRLKQKLFGKKPATILKSSIPPPPPPPPGPEGNGRGVKNAVKDTAQQVGGAVLVDGSTKLASTVVGLVSAGVVGASVGGTAVETEILVKDKEARDHQMNQDAESSSTDIEDGSYLGDTGEDTASIATVTAEGVDTTFGAIPKTDEGRAAMLAYISSTTLTGDQKRKIFEMMEKASPSLSPEDQEWFMTAVAE